MGLIVIFRKHYSLGPADLQFGGQATNIKGLPIVLDSGSTYSYFSSQAYSALVSMVRFSWYKIFLKFSFCLPGANCNCPFSDK